MLKSPIIPTCINLILTNRAHSFQSICVLETGLSDFHLMSFHHFFKNKTET